MKYINKSLIITLIIAAVSLVNAGTQSWQSNASYAGNQSDTDTASFWTTATTQFSAQITGIGPISGAASASSDSGYVVFIAGFFFGSVDELDSGTASSGEGISIFTSINSYYAPGTFGTAKVTATW